MSTSSIAIPLILLIFGSMCLFVNSQDWSGTFQVQPTCNRLYCCCLNNPLRLSKDSDSTLNIWSSLVCKNDPTVTLMLNYSISYPNEYSIKFPFQGSNLTASLNSNSSAITVNDVNNPQCIQHAIRVNKATIFNSVNHLALVFILFISTILL